MKKIMFTKQSQLIVLLVLSFIINLLFMPSMFRFNHDAVLSTEGMLIADSYRIIPFNVSWGILGYCYTGEFVRYANWPPLHFITLNFWDSIFSHSLFSSRMLSVLITSLTVPFFFLLIFRTTSNQKLAFISSILFIFFPFRILYGSLIFCDIWVPFFLCSGLLMMSIFDDQAENRSTLHRIIHAVIIGLYLGIGTLFSWQTFFILPAIVIYDIAKHKKNQYLSLLSLIIGSVIFLLWLTWILLTTKTQSTNSTVTQFLNRSIIGFIYSPSFWFDLLIKRILKLMVDATPLLILSLTIFVRFKSHDHGNRGTNNSSSGEINKITWVAVLTIVLYLAVMPGMFAPHEFQFIFFHPVFAIVFVSFIMSHKLESLLSNTLVISYIALSLIIYFLVVPRIHSTNQRTHDEISDISRIIKQENIKTDRKPILFLNSSSMEDSLRGKKLALSYLFNSFTYTLNKKYPFVDSTNSDDIENYSMVINKRMPSYLKNKIDKSQIYLISDKPLKISIGHNQRFSIRSIKTDSAYVYSMENLKR